MAHKQRKQQAVLPVSSFLARWTRARRMLNSGWVTPIDAENGDYRIRLDRALEQRNEVIANIFAGVCECKPPQNRRKSNDLGEYSNYGVWCEHLNAAFLYAEAALAAVEIVEEMVNQLNG